MRRTPFSNFVVAVTSVLICGFILLHWGIRPSMPVWIKIIIRYREDPPPTPENYTLYSPNVSSSDLQSRLRTLLQAPLPTYGEALEQNQAENACPKEAADRQAIAEQLNKHKNYWPTISNAELAKKRIEMVKYLEDVQTGGWDLVGRAYGGRGIVMTGGNKVGLNVHPLEGHSF
jgi:hypothetical protein